MSTMMDARDCCHVWSSKGDVDRTIGIPTIVNVGGVEKEIKTVDFDLTQERCPFPERRGGGESIPGELEF